MYSSVILLRAPTGPPDRYEAAFRDASFEPFSLPVLESTLEIDGLKDVIKHGPVASGVSGGVIITSARSAEAWRKAVDELLAGMIYFSLF